jgi:predicted transporter
MEYSIIFWLIDTVKKFFGFKNKVLHLIFGIKVGASCRNGFKTHKILTMASIYILEVLCTVVALCTGNWDQ